MLDQMILWIIVALVIITVILFALLFFLCLRKWSTNRHTRFVEAYRAQLRSPMQRYLLHGGEIPDQLMPDGDSLKFEALESLLSHFSDLLSSSDIRIRIRIYAEYVFAEQYRKWLNAGGASRKLNALFHIDSFHLCSFETDLLERVEAGRDMNLVEMDLIYRILASFGSDGLLNLLREEPPRLPDLSYRDMLARIPESKFPLFIDLFPSLTPQLKYALIDVIGIRQRDKYIGFLESLLNEQESELRIRVLKALSEMRLLSLSFKDMYVKHAAADNWQERMMVAKLFGTIRSPSLLPYLETMLGDSSWWVRQQAGKSIMRFREGKGILTWIRNESPDRFARDIASEWLDKEETGNAEY